MKFEEIDSQQNLAYLLRTFNGMPLKRLLETREEMRKALRITEELGAFISGKHDGKPDEDFYHDLRGTYGQMEFLISELARNRIVIVTDNGKTVGKFDMTDMPGLKKALEAQGKKFCDNNAQDITGFIQKQQKDSGMKVQDAEKPVRDLKIPF